MVLPTDVTPGYPGHADLHNDVNEAVNALAEDTGWRLVVTAAQVGNDIIARRVGAVVTIAFDPTENWAPWGTPTWLGATIPVGLQPDYRTMVVCAAEGDSCVLDVGNNGGMNLVAGPASYGCGSVTYLTSDPYPDPLPGTAYP